MARASARWTASLKRMTSRGFVSSWPLFEDLVWGPTVEVGGDDPPRELREKTIAAIVQLTLTQRPS